MESLTKFHDLNREQCSGQVIPDTLLRVFS